MNIGVLKNGSTTTEAVQHASIRVSPHGYFAALFLSTFVSAFLVYLDYVVGGFVLFAVAWVIIPLLAFTDRVAFDGKRVFRTGFVPTLWSKLNSSRNRLKVNDIEQVETQAMRTLKRGRNVFYRYRTSIRGKGVVFTFASGGEGYRNMASALLPLVPENSLDNRSIEIRDYLRDPKTVLEKARSSHIPSSEVLESTLEDFRRGLVHRVGRSRAFEHSVDEANQLRSLANQLRLSGFLLQALEAFRRAVLLRPYDGWLWLEFGRCLHSLAGSEKDPRLNRRSIAMMRLAERHAGADGKLLARLGESYYQAGELARSASVFQKAISVIGDNFRSARGLAEVSLREGKIAHVIHHFWAANRAVDTPALRRWSQSEADYFARLNDDDEYMEMELSRVNLLEKLERGRRTALRIAILGFPMIIVGVVTGEYLLANLGWTVSLVSMGVWTAVLLGRGLLSARIPFDLIERDREE